MLCHDRHFQRRVMVIHEIGHYVTGPHLCHLANIILPEVAIQIVSSNGAYIAHTVEYRRGLYDTICEI